MVGEREREGGGKEEYIIIVYVCAITVSHHA